MILLSPGNSRAWLPSCEPRLRNLTSHFLLRTSQFWICKVSLCSSSQVLRLEIPPWLGLFQQRETSTFVSSSENLHDVSAAVYIGSKRISNQVRWVWVVTASLSNPLCLSFFTWYVRVLIVTLPTWVGVRRRLWWGQSCVLHILISQTFTILLVCGQKWVGNSPCLQGPCLVRTIKGLCPVKCAI